MKRLGAHTQRLAPHASRRRRLPLALAGLFSFVLFIIPLLRAPVHAQGATDATEIIAKALHQGFSRHSFQVSIEFLRSDPTFLEKCLPPYEENGLKFSYLEGKVEWTEPERYDIYLWPRGRSDMVAHFSSSDGFDLALVSTEGFKPGPAPGAATPTPTPTPAATPSEATNPDGSAASPAAAPPPADAMSTPYRYHPLTLLWPFQLKKTPVGVTFTLAGEDTLAGRACWKLNRIAPDITMTIWVTKDDYSFAQIEYPDPVTSKITRFNANSYSTMPPDPAEPNQVPMIVYSKATVGSSGTPLCDVSALNAPSAVAATPSPSPTEGPATTTVHHSGPTAKDGEPRLLSNLLFIVVLALLVGLIYFGGRYVIYLVTRAMFNKELIVLDEANGPLTRALQNLGYAVVPASMEILTEERNRLGKKPGAVLPRAVVIAPHCIALAKNYLFLLKAYVEEGGRVMLFNHSMSDLPNLPFHMYMVPSGGDKVVLQAKQHLWKRLREEDVETKTSHLLPREFIVEVDHKRPDLDIVQAFNRATGIRATAVGVSKSGKGEYLVCQFLIVDDLKKSKLETSPITKLILLDLIDYLQGRTKEKEAAASPSGGA